MSKEPAPPAERDSLPKMFIVCGIIAFLLFSLVAGVILFDFFIRTQTEPIVPPDANLALLTIRNALRF